MLIPRFSLWSLMVAVTIVAAWCATFGMDSVGTDLRRLLQFVILTIAAASVLQYRAKLQAFWIGFLFVFLLVGCEKLRDQFQPLVPQIQWARVVAAHFEPPLEGQGFSRMYYPIYDTVWLSSVLLMSCVGGCISLVIYRRALRSVP